MGLYTSVCHTSFSNVPRPPRQSAGPEQSMAEPRTRDCHEGKGECDRCVCVGGSKPPLDQVYISSLLNMLRSFTRVNLSALKYKRA